MEHIAKLFEGCYIGRFKIGWLFKYSRECTIHFIGIFTDNNNDKYRITVSLFINDNNECEFKWQKFYCDNMHDTHNEVTDEDITSFERMSV